VPTQPPIQWVPGALSLGVKWPEREVYHLPPSSVEFKECMELYLHSPNTPSWRVAQLKKHRNNFTFTTVITPCLFRVRKYRLKFLLWMLFISNYERIYQHWIFHSSYESLVTLKQTVEMFVVILYLQRSSMYSILFTNSFSHIKTFDLTQFQATFEDWNGTLLVKVLRTYHMDY
jgi:hypothetical protein